MPTGTSDAPTVLLWWAELDLPDARHEELTACLAADERRRAERLRDPRHRRRFLAARGWRRRLLAEQLGCDPAEVAIVPGRHGKPRLSNDELYFSVAHSGDRVLVAVSPTAEVGVDVEHSSRAVDVEGLAGRFFTPAESRAIASIANPDHRRAAFFACWTRKEAYGKGTGVGLGFAMETVEVWCGDDAPVTVQGWSIHHIPLTDGFVGAVAASAGGVAAGSPHVSAPRQLA